MFQGSSVDNILKYDALIKYYLHLPTENMSDDEWSLCINQIVWCIKRENDLSKINK